MRGSVCRSFQARTRALGTKDTIRGGRSEMQPQTGGTVPGKGGKDSAETGGFAERTAC
jgi:hypothetical protein